MKPKKTYYRAIFIMHIGLMISFENSPKNRYIFSCSRFIIIIISLSRYQARLLVSNMHTET